MDNITSINTHLVVIIDLYPSVHLLKEDQDYEKWLNSIISFCMSHFLLNNLNKLHIIVSNFASNEIIYPLSKEADYGKLANNGQHYLFNQASQIIFKRIRESVTRSKEIAAELNHHSGQVNDYPLISGALAIGLCCIQRCKSQVDSSRIAIFTANNDSSSSFSSQFMNFMNVFFTAQKMNVVIDTCILSSEIEDSRLTMSIFQQGCDLTNGLYLKLSNLNAFLEYLIWTLLPDTDTRKKLVLPTQKKISYKAACFCHRNLIDIGYVCSICLSIFCTFSPICSTCHTVFKLGPLPPGIKIKRKTAKVK
jgi:hypothetical protein